MVLFAITAYAYHTWYTFTKKKKCALTPPPFFCPIIAYPIFHSDEQWRVYIMYNVVDFVDVLDPVDVVDVGNIATEINHCQFDS